MHSASHGDAYAPARDTVRRGKLLIEVITIIQLLSSFPRRQSQAGVTITSVPEARGKPRWGGGACGATLGICRTPEVLHFSYSSIVQLFHRSLSLYLSVYLFICEFAFMSLFICIFFIHGSLSIPPSSSPYRRPFSPMPLSLPPDAFHQPSPRFLKGRETR